MKKILFILLTLLSVAAQAQVTIDQQYYNRSKSSNIWDRVGSDSILFAPRVKAFKGKNEGSIMYNRALRTLEVYDSATARWYVLAPIAVFEGLISGGNVSWTGTGLQFYVSEAVYVINGQLYNSNDTTVTLAAADGTNPRQDVIALNNLGVRVLTGTPAADPAKPQVTPTEEIELTSILVAAGATTPGGITQEVIYDENTEWTVAASGITANANNTLFTYRGSKSIDVDSYTAGTRTITFTKASVADLTQYSLLTLYVRLKADYSAAATVSVQFRRVSGFLTLSTSSIVTISNGSYNYIRTNDGVYQVIQIPLSAFTYSSSLFAPSEMNRLVLTFNDAGSGMYLDYINLQGGLSIPASGVTTFNSRSGNVTPIKDDYDQWFIDTTYRRSDSVFATKNGVERFQFKDSVGGGGSQDLQDVTDIGFFTTNPLYSSTGFQVRNAANTTTLGEWINNSNSRSEIYMYNTSTGRQGMLGNNLLEFKGTGFNYQAIKPFPTPSASYTSFLLPNTAAVQRYFPMTFKLNDTTYSANDTGLVDFGTITVSVDSGGIASRPVSPTFGQRYFQTNELAGWYTWNGRYWDQEKPYDMIFDFTFTSKAYNTSPGITLSAAGGGDWRSITAIFDGTTDSKFYVHQFAFYTAAATAKSGFRAGPGSTLSNFTRGADSSFVFHTRVGANALSDATNSYTIYAGANSGDGASDGNGEYFKYTHSNNSGQWQCITKTPSGTTTINTSVAFATLTAYDLVIVYYNHNKVEFFINGTMVGQSTTNIGVRQFDTGAWMQRSAGTGVVYMAADRLKFYRF